MSIVEIQRRVDRGRAILARQREIVAKFGEHVPVALALLDSFEAALAILETNLATCLRAEADQEVASCDAVVAEPVPICFEASDASAPKMDYEEQLRGVAYLMEILREGGYHCELAEETLH